MRLSTRWYGLFALSLVVFLGMADHKCYAQKARVNFGIKAGVNALSTNYYDPYFGENSLSNGSFTNKNGYLVSAFMRINYDRVFLQPELTWNYYLQECFFSLPIEDTENEYYPETKLDIDSRSLNANILFGYNIIKSNPFLFNFYIGTSFKGIYSRDYDTNFGRKFSENEVLLNYTGIVGLSLNISKLHFDMRYELNQSNTNLDLSKIPDFPEKFHGVTLKKNENILSFSCGIMF
jgi:hypothetical protein